MAWYKHWFGTRYYKLLYGHRDEEDARDWVEAILRAWSLHPGSRVLDLACGRGRHVRWFLAAGMEATGIDISEASIAEARSLMPGVDLRVQDMREPFAVEGYDAVVCLFTSLGYFDTIEDDRKVFAAVAEALKPGGRFVLDFMNSPLVLRDLVKHEELEREGVFFRIDRRLENGVLVKCVIVRDGDVEHHFEERVQALTPRELELMALEAGLVIDDRTDGPDLKPFDDRLSQRFVLWTRKPLT
ncbi:MAG: class I SAM-dependent methyltransferase [Flavobacteriales bacterium]|nr:class I SAM-dependent methyltransferase [Flavobacteriales bacterium]MBP6696438.1 class I SAM-dependent methyltransferase [Flavobacteriales bacterium]